MTHLASYLRTSKISQREFAHLIGIDPSVVSRFVRGSARPGIDVAFAIERATNGAVPASSWVSADTKGAA